MSEVSKKVEFTVFERIVIRMLLTILKVVAIGRLSDKDEARKMVENINSLLGEKDV